MEHDKGAAMGPEAGTAMAETPRELPGSAREAMEQGLSVLMGVRAEYVTEERGVTYVSVVDDTSGSGRVRFPARPGAVSPSETGMFGYKSYDVVLGGPDDIIETIRTSRDRTIVLKAAGEIAGGFDPHAQVGWRGGMALKHMAPTALVDRGEACVLEGVKAEALSPEADGPDGPFRLMAVMAPDGCIQIPIASCRATGREDGSYDVFLGYGDERVSVRVEDRAGRPAVSELAGWYAGYPQEGVRMEQDAPDAALAPDDVWLHGVRAKYVGSAKSKSGYRTKQVSVADRDSPTGRDVFAVEECCVVKGANDRHDVLVGRPGCVVPCAVGRDDAVFKDAAGIAAGFDLETQIWQAVRDGTAVLGPDGRPTLASLLESDGTYDTAEELSLEGVPAGNVLEIQGGQWLVSVVDPNAPGGAVRFLSDNVSSHAGEPAGTYDVMLGRGRDFAMAARSYVQNGYVKAAYERNDQSPLLIAGVEAGHGGLSGLSGGDLFPLPWKEPRNRGYVGIRIPDAGAASGYGYAAVSLDGVRFRDGAVLVDFGPLGSSAGRYKWRDGDKRDHEEKMTVEQLCRRIEETAAGAGVRVEVGTGGRHIAGRADGKAPSGGSVNLDPLSDVDFSDTDRPVQEPADRMGGTMGQWARVVKLDDGKLALRGMEAIRMQAVTGSDLRKVYVRDVKSSSNLRCVYVDKSAIREEPEGNRYTVVLGWPGDWLNSTYELDRKRVSGRVSVSDVCVLYEKDCAARSVRAGRTCRLDGLVPGRDVFPVPSADGKDGMYARIRIPDPDMPGGHGELVIRRDAMEVRDGRLSLKLGLRDEELVGYRFPAEEGQWVARTARSTVGRIMDEAAKEARERALAMKDRGQAEKPVESRKPAAPREPVAAGRGRGREIWLSEIPPCCVSGPRMRDGKLMVDIKVPDPASPYGVGSVQVGRDRVRKTSAGLEAMIGYANEALPGYVSYERYGDGASRRVGRERTAGDVYAAMKDGRGTLAARVRALPAPCPEVPDMGGPGDGRDVTD